ncbi:tetratricopeptide repeat protein [Leptolyngbya sp. FACHB-541]|uniref:tetratricopeptide repeat protein n=1 Tax=Leptolyngbya sp. FACHB-541 TaxID=2692810 RepID=UPI001682F85F|nr:tetratricopeptide repeat protein [Leptolyngbya sp. FACHB-541]MBD1995552.1 tetratricopeptide repeat protein [Leptolyngbya sp. FACHB-541]
MKFYSKRLFHILAIATLFSINSDSLGRIYAAEEPQYNELSEICSQIECANAERKQQDSADSDSAEADELNRAVDLDRSGNKQEALAILQELIQRDSNNALAYLLAGAILLELERFDEAIPYLSRAVEINPNEASAYELLGSAFTVQSFISSSSLQRMLANEQAILAFRRAREIYEISGNAESVEVMTRSLLTLQDWDTAHEEYRIAVELFESGKRDEALDRLLSLRVEAPNYLPNLAECSQPPANVASVEVAAIAQTDNNIIPPCRIFEGESLEFSPTGDKFVLLRDVQGCSPLPSSPSVCSTPENPRNYLYDISGNQLAVLQGFFLGFNETGNRIVTSVPLANAAGRYELQVYDASGQLLESFQEAIRQWSAEGDRVLTLSLEDDRSYLYDLTTGNQLGSFEGALSRMNASSDHIVTYSPQTNLSYLYNLSNNQAIELRGENPRFNGRGDRIITSSSHDGRSYLYDLSGNELAALEGTVPVIAYSPLIRLSFRSTLTSPDAFAFERIVTHLGDGRSNLYDSSGNRLAVLQGELHFVNGNGNRIITATQNGLRLYDFSGRELAVLQGEELSDYNATSDRILTISRERDRIYLYTLSGEQVDVFSGNAALMDETGNRIAINLSGGANFSYVYDITQNRLSVLSGAYPTLSLTGNHATTRSRGDNHVYLYDLSDIR